MATSEDVIVEASGYAVGEPQPQEGTSTATVAVSVIPKYTYDMWSEAERAAYQRAGTKPPGEGVVPPTPSPVPTVAEEFGIPVGSAEQEAKRVTEYVATAVEKGYGVTESQAKLAVGYLESTGQFEAAADIKRGYIATGHVEGVGQRGKAVGDKTWTILEEEYKVGGGYDIAQALADEAIYEGDLKAAGFPDEAVKQAALSASVITSLKAGGFVTDEGVMLGPALVAGAITETQARQVFKSEDVEGAISWYEEKFPEGIGAEAVVEEPITPWEKRDVPQMFLPQGEQITTFREEVYPTGMTPPMYKVGTPEYKAAMAEWKVMMPTRLEMALDVAALATAPFTGGALLWAPAATSRIGRIAVGLYKGARIAGLTSAISFRYGLGVGPPPVDVTPYIIDTSKVGAFGSHEVAQSYLTPEGYLKEGVDTQEALRAFAMAGMQPTIPREVWEELPGNLKVYYTPTERVGWEYAPGAMGVWGRGTEALITRPILDPLRQQGLLGQIGAAGIQYMFAPHTHIGTYYRKYGPVAAVTAIPHFGPTWGTTALGWKDMPGWGKALGIGAGFLPFVGGPLTRVARPLLATRWGRHVAQFGLRTAQTPPISWVGKGLGALRLEEWAPWVGPRAIAQTIPWLRGVPVLPGGLKSEPFFDIVRIRVPVGEKLKALYTGLVVGRRGAVGYVSGVGWKFGTPTRLGISGAKVDSWIPKTTFEATLGRTLLKDLAPAEQARAWAQLQAAGIDIFALHKGVVTGLPTKVYWILRGTSRLSAAEVDTILRSMARLNRAYQVRPYGSEMTAQQLTPEGQAIARPRADLDFQIKNISEASLRKSLETLVRDLNKVARLEGMGKVFRLSTDPSSPTLIQVKMSPGASWANAVDSHGTSTYGQVIPTDAWGWRLGDPSVKVVLSSGKTLQGMSLLEATKTKATSITTFNAGAIRPEAHRIVKDLVDEIVSLYDISRQTTNSVVATQLLQKAQTIAAVNKDLIGYSFADIVAGKVAAPPTPVSLAYTPPTAPSIGLPYSPSPSVSPGLIRYYPGSRPSLSPISPYGYSPSLISPSLVSPMFPSPVSLSSYVPYSPYVPYVSPYYPSSVSPPLISSLYAPSYYPSYPPSYPPYSPPPSVPPFFPGGLLGGGRIPSRPKRKPTGVGIWEFGTFPVRGPHPLFGRMVGYEAFGGEIPWGKGTRPPRRTWGRFSLGGEGLVRMYA